VNFDKNRPLFIGVMLLAAALLISLVWMLVGTNTSVERILFFPGDIDPVLHGESRLLPRYRNTDQDVRLLVQEIVLGPAVMGLARVVPRDLTVRSLMVRGGIAYIDFDAEILFRQESLNLTLEDAFAAIRETVQFNFRRIHTVVITIDGQIPGQPVFELTMRNLSTRTGIGKNALTNGIASL
jgi:hypothetical protein